MTRKIVTIAVATAMALSVGWTSLTVATAQAEPDQPSITLDAADSSPMTLDLDDLFGTPADDPDGDVPQDVLQDVPQDVQQDASGDVPEAYLPPKEEPDAGDHAHPGMGLELPRETILPVVAPQAAIPSSADLRQYAVPIGDQDGTNSCVAWTIAYAMMGMYSNMAGDARAIAPMYMYSQMMPKDNAATFMSDGFDIAITQGVDTQDDYMPQGNYNYWDMPTASQKANAAKTKFTGYRTLFANASGAGVSGSQSVISSELAAGRPVAIGLRTTSEFSNFWDKTDSTSVISDTSDAPGAGGGHAVLAVGYNATGLIIQNSWGARWGANGFATLSWDWVRKYVNEAHVVTGYSVQAMPAVMAATLSWTTLAGGSGSGPIVSPYPQTSWTALAGGSSAQVYTPSNKAWQVSEAPSWVTVTPTSGFGLVTSTPTAGSGNALVTLNAAANTGSTRTGTVKFTTTTTPAASATISVSQPGVTTDDCGATTTASCTWSDMSKTVSGVIETASDKDWFKITPTVTGTWAFRSARPALNSIKDPVGTIYASNGTTVVATDDDGAGDSQFSMQASLTAGQTYYLEVKGYSTYTGAYAVMAFSPSPTLGISMSTWTAPSADGTTVAVSVTSNTTWSATQSDDTWLLVKANTGFGDRSVSVSVRPNQTASARSGSVTFQTTFGASVVTKTLQVTQPAGHYLAGCRTIYTVYSSSAEYYNIPFSSNTTWTASTNDPWLTVSPSSGSAMDGTLAYTLTANATGLQRTGSVRFATTSGAPISTCTTNIVQPGETAALTLDRSTWSVANAAQTSVSVAVTSNTEWIMSSNVSWLSAPESWGTSNGTISLKAEDNFSTSSRTGVVTFTTTTITPAITRTISVTQPGATAVMTLDRDTWAVPTAAKTTQAVAVKSTVAWSGSSNQSWLTLSSASGAGDASVTLTAEENTTASSRTATATFTTTAGYPKVTRTVTVTQPPAATLTLDRTVWTVPSSAAAMQTLLMTSNQSWKVSSSDSWVTFSASTGSNTSAVTMNAAANTTTTSRTATVTVTNTTGYPVLSRTVAVTQPGVAPTLSTGISQWAVPSSAQNNVTVSVSSNTSWKVTSSQAWVTISPTTGSGNTSVTLTAAANTATTSRPAVVTFTTTVGDTVATATIDVTQPGVPTLNVDKNTWNLPSSAGAYTTVAVTSSQAWQVTSNQSWLTVSPTTGSGNGTVTLTATANATVDARPATVTFTTTTGTPVQTATVTVAQPGAAVTLSLDKNIWTLGSSAGANTTVVVSSNAAWKVSSNQSWLTVSAATGSGNGSVSLTAAA
ncbi:MAG: hypothetical protein FWD75_10640, partial [Propionibacteriaceae bacterium]|nr:hypothetical protein [Propionibacteriaceae bacterium]